MSNSKWTAESDGRIEPFNLVPSLQASASSQIFLKLDSPECPVQIERLKVRRFKVMVLLSILTLGGCKPAPDSSFINLAWSAVQIQQPGTVTSNAICPLGQQLLGGGFSAVINGNGAAVAITEDYPSSANTWTVTAEAGSQISGVLIATAYCFTTPNVQLNLLTVQANTTANPVSRIEAVASGTASCPVGSVLTGGGYRVGGVSPPQGVGFNSYISGEGPSLNGAGQANGWQAALTYPITMNFNPAATVFAVCARAYLSQGKIVTGTTSLLQPQQTATVHCPPNTFTSGGGYSYQENTPVPLPYTVYSSFSNTESQLTSMPPSRRLSAYDASGWRSDTTYAYQWPLTISANCIPFPK